MAMMLPMVIVVLGAIGSADAFFNESEMRGKYLWAERIC